MTRKIQVEVDGARATFRLLDDWAPMTTALVWDTLPFEDVLLRHGKLSGDAAFFSVDRSAFKGLPEHPELSETSIYKGFMVVDGSSGRGSAEFLISYGLAEYRWPDGRRYVTPVAEIEGDGSSLYDKLRRTWEEGAKTITVRRVD